MLSDTALRNIQACLASLDELSEGKFIFAENIIKKILTNICVPIQSHIILYKTET